MTSRRKVKRGPLNPILTHQHQSPTTIRWEKYSIHHIHASKLYWFTEWENSLRILAMTLWYLPNKFSQCPFTGLFNGVTIKGINHQGATNSDGFSSQVDSSTTAITERNSPNRSVIGAVPLALILVLEQICHTKLTKIWQTQLALVCLAHSNEAKWLMTPWMLKPFLNAKTPRISTLYVLKWKLFSKCVHLVHWGTAKYYPFL